MNVGLSAQVGSAATSGASNANTFDMSGAGGIYTNAKTNWVLVAVIGAAALLALAWFMRRKG